jgi:hypothetical protein
LGTPVRVKYRGLLSSDLFRAEVIAIFTDHALVSDDRTDLLIRGIILDELLACDVITQEQYDQREAALLDDTRYA